MITPLILAFQAASASQIIKSAIAEKARPVQQVTVDIDSTVSGVETHTKVLVSENRSLGRYRLDVKSLSPAVSLDRVIYISGPKVLIYDRKLDEYIVRALPPENPLGENLVKLLHLGVGLEFAIDPATAESLILKKLETASNWTVNKSASTISLSRKVAAQGKASDIEAEFSAGSMLPIKLNFATAGRYDLTTFAYGQPQPQVSFEPPSSARRAITFGTSLTSPKFATSVAADVANASRAAYAAARSFEIKVTAGAESSLIFWHGVQAKQEGSRVWWAYDGETLTILDHKTGRFYRGLADPESVSDYIAPLGARIDPTLRSLMFGANLMSGLYSPRLSGRLMGQITLTVPYDILELSTPEIRIELRVRRDNHLIGGMVTEDFDRSGHRIASSERTLDYISVNKPIPISEFRLKQNGKVTPLTVLFKPLKFKG